MWTHRYLRFRAIGDSIVRLIRLCLPLIAIHSASAVAEPQIQTTRFTQFGVDDGLSQGSVTALLQDDSGYLWIGTEDGLNRFDGYRFVVVDSSGDSADGGITSLRQGVDKRVRVGTATSGLYWVDDQHKQMTPCEIEGSQQLTERVQGVSLDADGNTWMATSSGVFRETIDCKFEAIATMPGTEAVAAIESSDDGRLFVATQSGDLLQVANETLNLFATLPEAARAGFGVSAIAGTASALWVATDGPEFFRLGADGTVIETVVVPNRGLLMPRVRDLAIGPDGDVWVAGLGIGLLRYRPDVGVVSRWWQDDADVASLAHNDTARLLFDRSGGLWVGTRGHGLSRLQLEPEGIAHYRHSANAPLSIANNMVTSFEQSRVGDLLWVGMDGGGIDLLDLDNGVLSRYRHDPADPQSLSSDRVWALHEDQQRRLWVGTWFGGLNKLEPETRAFEPVFLGNEARDEVVLSIAESYDGTIWFGTLSSGLYYLHPDNTKVRRFTSRPGEPVLAGDLISTLFVDRENRLWVGTWDAGISVIDDDMTVRRQLRKQRDGLGLPHDTVRAITEDSEGMIWVGTSSGVVRVDSQTFDVEMPDAASDIPSGTVYSILEDRGALWVSSNRGLARYSPTTRRVRWLSPADGLQGFEFNGGASLKLNDGRLAFGGTQGFNVFDSQRTAGNPFPPEVAMTRVMVEDREIDVSRHAKEPLGLRHSQNRVGFEFAGLHFTSPKKIRYEYRLDGLQPGWISTDADQRIANYANLAPGRYQFKVRAANKDGVWSTSSADFNFVIAAPWWATKTAFLAWTILAMLLIFLFVRWRTVMLYKRATLLATEVRSGTRRIAEQKRTIEVQANKVQGLLATKERLFARVSHEFRTPLTLILGPAQQLREDASVEQNEALSLIERNANRLLRLVEQLLDLARLSGERKFETRSIELAPLVSALVGSFRSLAEPKQVELRFDVIGERSAVVNASNDLLEAAVNNLLANAIKFTPSGGKVVVQLCVDGDLVRLSVDDSGPGLSEGSEERIFEAFERAGATEPGTGIGLAVVRESIEALGGTVSARNGVAGGAQFVINLPREFADISTLEIADSLAGEDQTSNSRVERNDADPDAQRPTVLIIEDHDDLRHYIGRCLACDFQCTLVENGEKGVALAVEESPDLVLSDVMLPGISGFEVTRMLRNDDRSSHIPIVLLTAREDRESLMRGLTEKADEYLTKPFDADELRLRLHNLIELRTIMRREALQAWENTQEQLAPSAVAEPVYGPRDTAFLEKLHSTLAASFADNNFGVSDLASSLAMSSRQLHRKLRALLGASPGDYLRDFRLREAKRLLGSGTLVGVVAQDCGFATQAHFGQCFKALYGVTPGEFAANPSAVRQDRSDRR